MRSLTLLLAFTLCASTAPACSDALDGPTETAQTGTSSGTTPNLQRGDDPYDPQGQNGTDDPPADPPVEDPPADPPVEDPPADPPVEDPPADPPCVETGQTGPNVGACYNSSDCCEGFCTYTGMDYVPGTCMAQVDVGAACETDAWCLSGHCTDGACQETECGGLSGMCWSTADCCGDLFCTGGTGYVPGSCAEKLPDGAACFWHDWCESGVCTDGICTSDTCSGNGEGCYEGTECCTGLCTFDQENPYIPGTCFSAQPLDANCLDDSWCESGQCVDGVCGFKGCSDAGGECWHDSACCEGFCTYTGASGYTPGACQPPQALDSFCLGDSWCESGSCVDGACKTAGCQAASEDCNAGTDCCSGLCTYSGQGELYGSCVELQPAGTPCVADMWCETTSCVDGVCQDLSEVVLTFGEIYETVFQNNGCAGGYCHSDPFGSLNFLDQEEAYWGLVNGTTWQPQCDIETYVVPGDPEASLLLHKVRPYQEGDVWCGDKMPLGTLGLDDADVALVEAWIAQGALP